MQSNIRYIKIIYSFQFSNKNTNFKKTDKILSIKLPFKNCIKLNKKQNNLNQFKNFKKTEKLPQNPVDTIVYPPSFPRVHNYFGVCGHNSVPPH